MAFDILKRLILPKSTDEDKKRKEFILNIILASIIILLTAANLSIAYKLLFSGPNFDKSEVAPIGITLGLLGFFAFLYILSKKGLSKLSSLLLSTTIFVSIIALEITWGIELVAAILFSVVMIVIAGILLSTRLAFFSAILLSFSSSAIYVLDRRGIISPDKRWETDVWDSQDVSVLCLSFLIIAALSWLSNREIEKSLTRARKSEAELKKERDNLEIRVEEKTKEIKEMQLKEITQFHRLAEFGRLSAGLFHELANPLTALNLNIDEMRGSASNNDQWTVFGDNLDRATKATKKMGNFINSIKKQVAVQNEKSYFSANKEIEDAIEILSYKARKHFVNLLFEADAEIMLTNDPLKFHQIAANLISNAIDSYSGCDRKDGREVIIKLDKNELGVISFTVRDKGKGIPQGLEEKIFEAFFSTKEFGCGTGLGLAITKTLVENDFRGKISASKEPGGGSLFVVSIPE